MPKDRSQDRHQTDRHAISVSGRLWQQFGDLVGPRQRSAVIRDLIRRYVAGEPMPLRPEPRGRPKKTT